MYQITGSPEAEVELVIIEMEMESDFELADEVVAAMELIDLHLAMKPLRVGKMRSSSVHRYITRDPLAVDYEVVEDDKSVIIHGVSLLPRPPEDDVNS